MIKVVKTGEWQKVELLLRTLVNVFTKVRREHLQKLSAKGLEIVLGHFDDQDLNWEPLGDPYKAWKAKQGLSTDTLMATKRYRESIEAKTNVEQAGIGVRLGAMTLSGEEMDMIAMVHEYGSRGHGIPERPLWQPSFNGLMEWWEGEGFPAYDILKQLV